MATSIRELSGKLLQDAVMREAENSAIGSGRGLPLRESAVSVGSHCLS